MRRSLATSLLAVVSVQAFSDSSPFVLFSSAKLASASNNDQLQTSAEVISTVKQLLASCPTDRYLLVSQPNVHASDLRGPSGCKSPELCKAVEAEQVQSRWSVAEMLGNVSFDDFANYIKTVCLKQDRRVTVDERILPALPSGADKDARTHKLAVNDNELGHYLSKARGGEYTVIYFSNPNEFKSYEAEFADPVRVELKRDTSKFLESSKPSHTPNKNLPLFEKYQFFTPGIFMAFLALFIILAILYGGLAALSSLEVPYGAFEKEMGPASQKKSG